MPGDGSIATPLQPAAGGQQRYACRGGRCTCLSLPLLPLLLVPVACFLLLPALLEEGLRLQTGKSAFSMRQVISGGNRPGRRRRRRQQHSNPGLQAMASTYCSCEQPAQSHPHALALLPLRGALLILLHARHGAPCGTNLPSCSCWSRMRATRSERAGARLLGRHSRTGH